MSPFQSDSAPDGNVRARGDSSARVFLGVGMPRNCNTDLGGNQRQCLRTWAFSRAQKRLRTQCNDQEPTAPGQA
jgi:hypothetical protein